jgi:hypothetical protein
MCERLHHRMLWRVGLQQHPSRRLRAAGAAGHLVQQLHRALGGAQIAAGQPKIGIDHADQRQMRKMPAFGDDLRADDEVNLPRRDRPRRLGGSGRPGHGIARHDQQPRVGKPRPRLLGDPLHAGTNGCQAVLGLALRALGGDWHGVPTMVALQHATRAASRRCCFSTAVAMRR